MDLSTKGLNNLFSSVNQCNRMVEDAGGIRCVDCGSTNECEEDSDNPGDYYCKHCWEEYNSEEEKENPQQQQNGGEGHSTFPLLGGGGGGGEGVSINPLAQVVPPASEATARKSRLKKDIKKKAPSLSADDLAKRQEQETARQAMLASVKRRNSDRMVLRSKNEREDEVKDLKQLIDGLDNETKLHFIQYKLKQAIDKNTMSADDLGSQLIAELNQYQKLLCNIQKDRDAIAAAPLAEAPSLAVASIATTAISSVPMVGRKGPVLVGQIAAAKRTTRTTRKRSAVQPAAAAHSVVGTRSSKRTNISSRTSSSKPAAKKRKEDPLISFNKPLKKPVLDRMKNLSQFQELQTKFDEILKLAVKNPAVRAELCRILNLSDEILRGDDISELDALLAGYNDENLDRGTTSEELWIVFKLGKKKKTHLSAIINELPLLLHQEGLLVVAAWSKNGGKVSKVKASVSGILIRQQTTSTARLEEHTIASEANGGSVGQKINLYCNSSSSEIEGTDLTCRDIVMFRGTNSVDEQKKGIVVDASTVSRREAIANNILLCDVKAIFPNFRQRGFELMNRQGKPFIGTLNSREGMELLKKPLVFKHAIFAPGLTEAVYLSCCNYNSSIRTRKQPDDEIEFGPAKVDPYVDGKGVTTFFWQCRVVGCCKKKKSGYNECCMDHSKAFVNQYADEAAWEQSRNENES